MLDHKEDWFVHGITPQIILTQVERNFALRHQLWDDPKWEKFIEAIRRHDEPRGIYPLCGVHKRSTIARIRALKPGPKFDIFSEERRQFPIGTVMYTSIGLAKVIGYTLDSDNLDEVILRLRSGNNIAMIYPNQVESHKIVKRHIAA